MDNEPNAHMQVDPSTNPMSAIQAFKLDPSNEWVIESVPGFVAIKHKIGCSICDASASHCMAAKRSYEIRLAEKDVSHAVAEAWPELVRVTIQNLTDQVQSLEKELQEAKDNSAELSRNKDLILENKHLKRELEYYIGRTRYALHGKDAAWAEKNGYRLSDIPASDGEDDDEDPTGLPTIPEDIPQYIPVVLPNSRARIMSKKSRNDSQVVHEAGIPAIGGYRPSPKQKRIIADPPASITGVLPKPLGKSRAERWDQLAFRGASEWILEQDVHDVEMRRLYAEAKALPLINGLLTTQRSCSASTNWMTDVIQSFNSNPSGVPRNLQLEGLHINVDDTDVWYWVNLIKPKFRGAEAESLLQDIFSSIGRWEKLVAGRWKRNDSLFLCSPTPARYEIPRHQKLDTSQFTYWLGCDAGVTPELAREKIEPYFIQRSTRTIWNKVTLCSLLRANEIASLKGVAMNHFRVHDDLLPLVQGSLFYSPPTHTGSSSLANRLDYGEGGSFSQPPADACELQAHISYFDRFVPQGTVCASMAELSEELTRELYVDNHE
ncbi:hypothetical protein M422DRAFT_269713 [Sphaerobolus stellatus SS14]|uniref:Unplaced genomic scaffold SPHSTscaffold_219, whole genome shotgun sequence n=1 Tax=Sphaerobolus stellatus (strain SS14) TaxID=990650 RepID=A0A0C9UUE6_SPHS4|nr:hypothetical protein M422DRAFT_269713 [Sphaerobolus stellatus SS14]